MFLIPVLTIRGAGEWISGLYQGDVAMPYILWIPDGYDPDDTTTEYPLIVNLHGQGEKGLPDGSKNGIQRDPATGKWTNNANQSYQKSFVFAPQVVIDGESGTGNWTSSRVVDTFVVLLDELTNDYHVDTDRIYLTGISMGGAGAFYYATWFPDIFAAIGPSVGFGQPKEAYPFRDKPIWAITAENDGISYKGTESYDLHVMRFGGKPILTQYKTGGHGVSGAGFGTPGYYEWMMAQRLGQLPVESHHPYVRIETPTTDLNYLTTESTIDLSGTLGDGTTAVTEVNWRRYGPDEEEATGTATGTDNWSVSGIPLLQGENIIVIEAVGTSYNTGNGGVLKFRDNIKVRYLPEGVETELPQVTFTTPTSGTEVFQHTYDSISLSGTASDNVGVVEVRWKNNRGPASGVATGTTNWSVSDIPLERDLNVIQIIAIDAANNRTTEEFWVRTKALNDADNLAPVVDTGVARILYDSTMSTTLTATVTDDQLPDPGNQTYQWSKVSGPGSVTFGDATAVDTTVTFDALGEYVLRLEADDGALAGSDDIRILVSDIAAPAISGLFSQDFNSTTDLVYYQNPEPGDWEFTDISAEPGGGTWSVNGSGQLQIVREGNSAGAGLTWTTGFSGPPTMLKASFDLGLDHTSGSGLLFYFEFGDYPTVTDYNSNGSNADLGVRMEVRTSGSGFAPRLNGTSAPAMTSDGSTSHMEWYVNFTGSPKAYLGPDGTNRTLLNRRQSLWIDGVLVIDNIKAKGSFPTLPNFRVRFPSSAMMTVVLDDLLIEEMFETPDPNQNSPVAADDDSATTREETAVLVSVLDNDFDYDAAPSSIAITNVGTPSSGVAVQEGDKIRYTPALNFVGDDSFDYTITDGDAPSTATVFVTVTDVRDPDAPASTENGLTFQGFVNDSDPFVAWQVLPDFSSLTPSIAGPIENFIINTDNSVHHFGMVFEGFVEVPESALYTFYTSSDDGSALYIGDTKVVDNDGLHGVVEAEGVIDLKAGKHSIRVEFFEASGGQALNVFYEGGSLDKTRIPDSALFRESGSGSQNLKPVVTVDSDITLNLPVNQTQVSGSFTDDGMPDGSTVTTLWSQVSGPSIANIQSPMALTTMVDFEDPGVYVMRLSADDSDQVGFADINITVSESSVVAGDSLFFQDFALFNTVGDYIDASDNTRFFEDISAESDGGTFSIQDGALRNVRSGTTSADDDAGFTILNLFPDGTELIKVTFDMGVVNPTTFSSLYYLEIGNYGSVVDYGTGGAHSSHAARLNVRGSGTDEFKVRINSTQFGDYTADGTMMTWTWYVNRSASAETYTGPDGGSHSVSPLSASVWIGQSLALDNIAMEGGFTGTPKDFRMRLDSGFAITVSIDNILIADSFESGSADAYETFATNNGLSGDDALSSSDPDGDSISNLLEYILMLDPNVNNNAPAALPQMSTMNDNNGDYLKLVFDQINDLGTVTVKVEVSDDLVTWNSGPTYTVQGTPVDNGDGTVRIEVVDRTPIPDTGARFVRLSAEQ
ncbi:PA14 domain-containing protein [Rubellicoccus peritrichatus]|uniref:PA14 domain-containing protein n=1 Tax=Rubellicoccus peritrichatus TaxID=3080537 RepID=A0AAQ3L9C0_9BACT|nr:PA14 domain-containing protein [Puniceicoccus sp. CR14]WOO41481.1 PA14 domain-containing protein [Puniceicoccus sp. CR14]